MVENNETGFVSVIEHIQQEVNFEPEYYNEAYLKRRISARMRRQGVDTYSEYLTVLREDGDEKEQLLDSLTINVTNFFRNEGMWEDLRDVLATLTRKNRSVKIWSAPCADGREPYSVYMLALDEHRVNESRMSVLGTDISGDALEHARKGVYQTTRTTDIGDELSLLNNPEKYVTVESDTFTVKPEIRREITFETHDLVQDGPKENHDLVFCRNLLIYIDTKYKMPVFETLINSLKPNGYLVVGMTETLPHEIRSDFTPVSNKHRIYQYTPGSD